MEGSRVLNPALRSKIMSSSEAAALIPAGSNVGMSGFTGSGYPKAVPAALAERINALRSAGEKFKISIWTGASTAPELDGALASVDGIEMRLPYQSDPACRTKINSGQMEYVDIHLSQVAQFVWFGFFGKLDVAIVEVSGILEDGRLMPTTSIGNNKTWLEQADKIILEVNSWMNPGSRRHARHILRHAPASVPATDPTCEAVRSNRRDVFQLRSQQGHRRR